MITDKSQKAEITVKGQKIPIWIYGKKDNPLILFIHGYFRGFSEMIGDLPVRHLMKDYCIVAFDLPGFGYSKSLDMDRIEFIETVVKRVANKRPYFIFGISYGGLLSLKFASKNKTNLNGVIIGGMPYFYGIKSILKLSYLLPFLKRLDISAIIKEFTFLKRNNLERINISVLLLYSSKDSYATAKMGRKLNENIRSSKLFTIQKFNHKWLMHRIDESGFLKEIEAFIKTNLKQN